VTRARPTAPERPPPTHRPRLPDEEREHRRSADKFAPRYEDERPMMVVRGPDGAVIPPAKPAVPAPNKDEPKDEPPTTNLRGPTPDEVLADPLVRTVLDVFQGEVKRIHPRPRGGGGE